MPTPDAAWSPLELDVLATAAGTGWAVTLHESASSTNAIAAAGTDGGGAVADTIVVADHQTAGRGRLDRTWDTPPGSALTFSAVVDPGLADHDWPLLPLAVALAVADGVRRAAEVPVELKWPNDLLIGEGKVAGILLELVASAEDPSRALAVIGIGINVGLAAEDLPVPTATSLAIAGSNVDRASVFAEVVSALGSVLDSLRSGPAAVLERYRTECSTIGRDVTVHLPDGEVLTGRATGLDRNGRLLVADRAIGAGDVVHVRPA